VPESRFAGKPSYTLRRSLKLGISALISNSRFPLHMGVQLGLIVAGLAILYVLVAIYSYLFGSAVPGWTSIIGVVLVLGAVQLLVIGVMAQYVGAIFDLTRKLPNYVVYDDHPDGRE
jgi:dolichol-phosphate mannosyltransferase